MKNINKQNILLSICIPTFNRVDILPILLESILAQNNELIEICISDNCSQDGTGLVVKKFQEKYNNIIYSKNEENLGFDRNIIKVVGMARGKFIWIIGDDDRAHEDSLKQIKTILLSNNNDLDLFLFNIELYNASMSRSLEEYNPNKHENSLKEYSTTTEHNIIDFFNNCIMLGSACGFIGSQIFLRDKWDSIESDEAVESGYIHLFIFWKIISKGAKIKYFSEKIVDVRTGNDAGVTNLGGYCNRALLDYNGISKISNLVWPKSKSVQISTIKLVKEEHKQVYSKLLNCLGMRALSTQDSWIEFYNKYCSYFGKEYPYCLVNFLPDFLFDFLHFIIKKIKLRENKLIISSRKKH